MAALNVRDWLDLAWARHAQEPAVLAEDLANLTPAPEALANLIHLAQHLYGVHLSDARSGLDLLGRWRPLAQSDADQAAWLRAQAALSLSGGVADLRATLSASERVRATALAASHLSQRDPERAGRLLQEAQHGAGTLARDDPAHRALAQAANNIACDLEEMPTRSANQRLLMLNAAQLARSAWLLAGTWLEVQRADYRLAISHLAAGDPVLAKRHAQACLKEVQAHGSVPLEAFFAYEALARSAQALFQDTRAPIAAARATFLHLSPEDQLWCRATLDALEGRT